jgi:hypothetical protein
MEGYLLQEWTTVGSGSATSFLAQSELGWIDLLDYRDVIFWLEVKSITLGGASAIVMRYETSPSKDEVLFSSMITFPMAVVAVPDVRSVLESQNPSLPLCRWLRWRLQAAGPTGNWGATFRIHCAANKGGLR